MQSIREYVDQMDKMIEETLDRPANVVDFERPAYTKGINKRDKALRDAEFTFYEAIGVPTDVPMLIVGDYDEENEDGMYTIADVKWQMVVEEERIIIYHNRRPYSIFVYSCRGMSYIIWAYYGKDDRFFIGSDDFKFFEPIGEVKTKDWMRLQFNSLEKFASERITKS